MPIKRICVKKNGYVDVYDIDEPFDEKKYTAIIECTGSYNLLRHNTGPRRIGSADRDVRNDFAANSSGDKRAKYYDTLGEAIDAFNDTLIDYGYHFHPEDLCGWSGNAGRKGVTILDEHRNPAGLAQIIYYKMPSGRWEVIGYIT